MSPMLQTEADRRTENEIAVIIGTKWRCECRYFGYYNPLDWYLVRDGRMIAVAELKARTHASSLYATIFLSFRKWISMYGALSFWNVPAVYVVSFTDGIRFIHFGEIPVGQPLRMAGNSRNVSPTDIEPMIEIPIELMRPLNGKGLG